MPKPVPYESTDELRKSIQQLISILDMADTEPVPIASAGLVALAEDHAKIMMRRLRPYVKHRINEAWPREDKREGE